MSRTLLVAILLIVTFSAAVSSNYVNPGPRNITYNVFSMQIPIVFNNYGRINPNGLIYALERNRPQLEQIKERYLQQLEDPNLPYGAILPHPLIRPLVLRCAVGDVVTVKFTNRISDQIVSIHLHGDFHDADSDGATVGNNIPSGVAYNQQIEYTWVCKRQGAHLFRDSINLRGDQRGTNIHGLFGALIVEPPGAVWSSNTDFNYNTDPESATSIEAMIHPSGKVENPKEKVPWLKEPNPRLQSNFAPYREFVVFFHDETEWVKKYPVPPNPCGEPPCTVTMEVNAINYRSEPMEDRLHDTWRRFWNPNDHPYGPLNDKQEIKGEEIHHSSWLFGDPDNVFPSYVGDPFRVHLIHAGVKETHVFHLHRYEWHQDWTNLKSPIIDAKSIGPGHVHTFVPFYGAGTRVGTVGDAVFHCHLYPHFDSGMWGIIRAYDTLRTGVYFDRYGQVDDLQHFPYSRPQNRRPIPALAPLTNRQAPPLPTPSLPGYPNFIPGLPFQKSPNPPWWDKDSIVDPRVEGWDYHLPTRLEVNAMYQNRHPDAKPELGAVFQKFPMGIKGLPQVVSHFAAVQRPNIINSKHKWVNWLAHQFVEDGPGIPPQGVPVKYDPYIHHVNDDTIHTFILRNGLETEVPETPYDKAVPECRRGPFGYAGEVGMHTHLVKADSLVADGSSIGYNYISGARFGLRMAFKLWVDEVFPAVYFHDHLFASFRQKYGLFGLLAPHPADSRILDPSCPLGEDAFSWIPRDQVSPVGPHKVILTSDGEFRRDITIGIADFVPAWQLSDTDPELILSAPVNNRDYCTNNYNPNDPPKVISNIKVDVIRRPLPGTPQNIPPCPGGVEDPGVMTVNYRAEPLRFRADNTDPVTWFDSSVHGDPETPLFTTFANDPLNLRFYQGSHEEPHSWVVHGMRWRKWRDDPRSWYTNQQVIGISEVFSINVDHPYGPGDYMYKSASIDDMWMGSWGIIRALPREIRYGNSSVYPLRLPYREVSELCPDKLVRRYVIRAVNKELTYSVGNEDLDMPELFDPFARVFEVVSHTPPDFYKGRFDGKDIKESLKNGPEPLTLRAYVGETLEIRLINDLSVKPGYIARPRHDDIGVNLDINNTRRIVSNYVSLHVDGLLYNVQNSDGVNLGHNQHQAVAPGQSRVYKFCIPPDTEPGPHPLRDMADIRFNYHHGLLGSVIVEPRGSKVRDWVGTVTTVDDRAEIVIHYQDGLRLYDRKKTIQQRRLVPADDFIVGNVATPGEINPPEPGEEEEEEEMGLEAQDQGQLALNYKNEYVYFDSPRVNLIDGFPINTAIYRLKQGTTADIHLVSGIDKSRGRTFHIHGQAWQLMSATTNDDGMNPNQWYSSTSAIMPGDRDSFRVTFDRAGDWAYRGAAHASEVQHGIHGVFSVIPNGKPKTSRIPVIPQKLVPTLIPTANKNQQHKQPAKKTTQPPKATNQVSSRQKTTKPGPTRH